MRVKSIPILLGILLLAFLSKLPRVAAPLGGHFAGHQGGYASMAYFYLQEHFRDVFHPKLFVLIGGEPGLRMLDFPVASLLSAIAFSLVGGEGVLWGRLQAIFFSTLSTLLVYLLARKGLSRRGALVAALAFTLSPLTMIYGRSFLNEPGAISLGLLALYTLLLWQEKRTFLLLILSAISLSAALLMRLQCFYFVIPLAFIFFQAFGRRSLLRPAFYFYFILGLSLPSLWYGYTYGVSKTSPHVFMSLFFQASVYLTHQPTVLFSPDFGLKLFDGLFVLLLTPLGFVLLLIGLVSFPPTEQKARMAWAWLGTLLATLFLFPKKYQEHTFYLWHFVPVGAIFVGRAAESLSEGLRTKLSRRQSQALGILLLGFAFIASLRYGGASAFVTPPGDLGRIALAEEAKTLIPPEAKVIVADQGGYLFFALLERKGWPFLIQPKGERREMTVYDLRQIGNLPKKEQDQLKERFSDPLSWFEILRDEGASYFIAVHEDLLKRDPEFYNYLEDKYLKIKLTSQTGALYDVRK